jgi:DinB superfamily
LPQAMTPNEENRALREELHSSRDRFLSLLESVPENLRDIRPEDGAWSIMDCAEHICIAEELMSVSLQNRRSTDTEPDLRKDAVVRKVALDRSRKIVAPERARPTGRYRSLVEAAEAFRSARGKNIALIESLGEDLRHSTCLHPLGVFDTYQFARIMALHPERHAAQIEEIKNSAAYRAATHL